VPQEVPQQCATVNAQKVTAEATQTIFPNPHLLEALSLTQPVPSSATSSSNFDRLAHKHSSEQHGNQHQKSKESIMKTQFSKWCSCWNLECCHADLRNGQSLAPIRNHQHPVQTPEDQTPEEPSVRILRNLQCRARSCTKPYNLAGLPELATR